MKRGDLVTVAISGDFSNTPPVLVSDGTFTDSAPPAVLVASTLVDAPLMTCTDPTSGRPIAHDGP